MTAKMLPEALKTAKLQTRQKKLIYLAANSPNKQAMKDLLHGSQRKF